MNPQNATKGTIIRNRVKVLYRPFAGRARVRTCNIDDQGNLTINGGKHIVGPSSLFTFKGRTPWTIVHQGTVNAFGPNADKEAFNPQFLNEAISNHYARDVLDAFENYEKSNKAQTVVVVMVGLVLLASVIFGIWTLAQLNGLSHTVDVMQQQAAAAAANHGSPAQQALANSASSGAPHA